MLRLAFLLMFVPAAAFAVPDHWVRSIEKGLSEYRIDVDVSTLTTAQLTALHFELTSRERTIRRRLLGIIENG